MSPSVTYQADDARPVEQLGCHVGGVGKTQNGKRLYNPHFLSSKIFNDGCWVIIIYLGELRDESCDEAKKAAHGEAPDGNGEEGGDAQHNVHGHYLLPCPGHAWVWEIAL